MWKSVRAFICVVMAITLVLTTNVWSAVVSAEAAATASDPRFSYTAFTVTGLEITTKGVAYCTACAEGYDGITTKIHVKMTLQKYTVLWWSNQQSWEATYNGVDANMGKTTTVNSGRYRIKAVYTVYSGSAYEEIESQSQEKKITVS